MSTITKILIAGLLLGWGTSAYAQEEDWSEQTFDSSITTIDLDPECNVASISFTNGVTLDDPQIDLKSLEGLEISGIRQLPVQLWKIGDPANPEVVVVSDFAGMTPVTLPAGAGAKLQVEPYGRVMLLPDPGIALACPSGCTSHGGKCKCPKDVSAICLPTLVETFDPATDEFKVNVLMSELPVGSP